jgi:hypothetical protein
MAAAEAFNRGAIDDTKRGYLNLVLVLWRLEP